MTADRVSDAFFASH